MKKDVKELLKKFDKNPKLKVGDLVLEAQMYRVIKVGWHNHPEKVEVKTEFPRNNVKQTLIKYLDKKGGQHVLMKMKECQNQ